MGRTLLVAVAVIGAALAVPTANQAAQDEVHVQLLALNDFHGHVEQAPRLATAVRERRTQDTWVVGAGDMIGASPLVSGWFDDVPAIETLNAIGLDITAVGNHEFDDGMGALRKLRQHADFEYLAANVRGAKLPAYEVRRAEGVPIAFIGLTLEDTPSVTMPAGVAGLGFAPEVETVNALVRKLRRERQIETFVVLLHEGGFTDGDANECENLTGPVVPIARGLSSAVDVVTSAHTHEAYTCEVDGKVVTSAGRYGEHLTDIDLTINRRLGDVTGASYENVEIGDDLESEPETAAIVDRYAAEAAPIANRVVGAVDHDLSTAETGQLVAESFRTATGADVAYMNPGGIRASLDAGEVTFGDLYAVLPFGDEVQVRTMTGAQLATLGPGLYRAGTDPVDPAATYTVATRSFLMAGGDGFTAFRRAARSARPPVCDLAAFETAF